jgi:hypothetical protein
MQLKVMKCQLLCEIIVCLFQVPCLLRSLPDLFTTDLLLRLYDINTVSGRKDTARDLCMLRNMNLKMSMKDVL